MARVRDEVREVYFVRAFELGLIKIGVTNDTQRRIVSMQTLSPDRLYVMGVQLCRHGGSLEAELHSRFAEHRAHGEWFRPGADLLAYIEAKAIPLAGVPAARAEITADAGIIADIRRRQERSRQRWLRKNGFAHMVEI